MKDFLLDSYLTIRGIELYHSLLKRSQYFSREEMAKYQYKKLRRVLMEAAVNVPYYKELFQSIGFTPGRDFNTLGDLQRIPVLSKKEAKEQADKLLNKRFLDKSLTLKTSGSTGEPFSVKVSYNAWIIEQAVIWRHWKWAGYNFRDEMAIVRSFAPKDGQPLVKYDKVRNFTFYSPFHLSGDNIRNYLSEMENRHTKFLRGYPSSIFLLAEYLKAHDQQSPFALKAILTASEYLSENERQTIETTLNARIFNHYGLAEVCVMMGDCEKHEGLHNYDEYGYLELNTFDEMRPGIKNVVGTNLHNLAMPLIRYDTGDLAELGDSQTCSCGRSLPVIKNIIGRKDKYLVAPNGTKIPSVNFYTMLEHFSEIKKWQIVQVSPAQIDLYTLSDSLNDETKQKIQHGFNTRFQSEMNIRFRNNEAFYRVAEGKQNPVVSLI